MRSLEAPAAFESWFQKTARDRLGAALGGLEPQALALLERFFAAYAPPVEGHYAGETGGADDRVDPQLESRTRQALDAFLGQLLLEEAAPADPCRSARHAGHAAIAAIAQRERLRLALFRLPALLRSAHDLVSLDRVPAALWPEVRANAAQRQAWQALGIEAPDALAPGLPVDASLYPPAFRHALERALGPERDGLLVHGDNRRALTLLTPRLGGRVRCLYWDPPYNRGKDDFVYADTFREGNWPCMMADRLAAARALLAEDGALFQSIDDREVHRLRAVSEQVFGAEHFVANVIWQKKYTRANDARWFSDNHEHLLVFARAKQRLRFTLLPRGDRQLAAYDNPDGHPKGPWKATPLHAKSGRGQFSYTFKNGVCWQPPPGTFARFSAETLARLEADDAITFGADGRSVPARKTFLRETRQGLTPTTLWLHEEVGHTHEANSELKRLFPHNPFNNPKPLRLLERVLTLAAGPEDWIADAFAGSGTTGHAVVALNRRDGGRRRMLLVEREAYFDTLLVPRLLKALYAAEWRDGRPLTPAPQSFRLRLLKLEGDAERLARLLPPDAAAESFGYSWDFEAGELVWRWPTRLDESTWWAIAETFALLGGERIEGREMTPDAWWLRIRDRTGGLGLLVHGALPTWRQDDERPVAVYHYGTKTPSDGVQPFESAFGDRLAFEIGTDVMSNDFSSPKQEKSPRKHRCSSP